MLPPWLGQFLDPTRAPEQTGDFRVSPSFFLALIVFGFLVGTFGHIIKSKTLIIVGVTMIFGGTVVLPLLVTLTN